ncbi:hypothetical protein HYH02_013332 [Chlamydomonas schloesseri]|uniref:Protein kinase domain-containing protein n=1 Tax=Chlamydomonas schloesseri TaxID=2026947 RepID=A0A835STS4_9CHLO|nr:hypothetical protein HYH02_013332 [Chlamydomonas schloesseri]|eukprot:KAG2431342.1 hypothetical protein HYH02_013332 [Chlamydomonas schloesseri]
MRGTDPSKIFKPIPFQLDGIEYVLYYEPLTFVDAVATCAGTGLLPGGRPGSVLAFEALVHMFQHAAIARPDIANAIIEGYGLTADPAQGNCNLWVWDTARTCRAFWFDVANSMFINADVRCDWLLGFVCVDAEAAERRGWQTSLPWYRSYLASRALPSPAVALGPGAWGWSLAEGEAVGSFSPPASITAFFNSTPDLWSTGPPVSLLYRGGGHNLYALIPIHDLGVDTAWYLSTNQRTLMPTNSSLYWGGYDPTKDKGSSFEIASVIAGAHDYVVSVQGCYLPGVQLERLYFVTRTGRSLQFGRGYCTAWFRQDAPPGGYLAGLAGWAVNQTLWPTMGPPFDIDISFIYGIRPIWAVPPGGSAPPPMTVDLPPQLPARGNTCRSARPPVVTSPRQYGMPGECGAATGAVCNSNQCCGAIIWGKNRMYASCGTDVTPCQTGCMSGYGMCGSLPDRPQLTFVRPASPPLSSYRALLLDAANTPLVVNGSRVVNWTSTVTSPSAAYASAPLSGSNPHQPLPLVYVLKTDGAVTYSEALAFCNSSTHLGLSWELVGLPDSLGFTASGSMRREAYTAIKDTVSWFLSHPAYAAAAPTYGCVRGKFGALTGATYDVSIAGPGPCGITAAAMCRAVGLTSASTSVALASRLRQLHTTSGGTAAANATSSPAAWKPGRHAVWLSAKRGAGPFSSGSCAFALAAVPHLEVSLLLQVAAFTADTAASGPAGSSAAQNASSTAANTTSLASTAASNSSSAAAPVTLPVSYLDDVDFTGAQPPFAGLSLSRASFSDNSSDASDLIAGLRLLVDTSGAATRVIGVESSGGWEEMALAPGELVVAVSVCAGGFVERLILHTSTGRLLTHAWGRHARCTRSFTEAAPPGGYLLGMAGHVGSYVEDLVLAWGVPLPGPPPTAADVSGSSSSSSSSSKNTTAIIVGSVVGGTVLLVGLLVAALLVRRRSRSSGHQQKDVPKKSSTSGVGAGNMAKTIMDPRRSTSNSGGSDNDAGGGTVVAVVTTAAMGSASSAQAGGTVVINLKPLAQSHAASGAAAEASGAALFCRPHLDCSAGDGTALVPPGSSSGELGASSSPAGGALMVAAGGGGGRPARAPGAMSQGGGGGGGGLLVSSSGDTELDAELDTDLAGAGHDSFSRTHGGGSDAAATPAPPLLPAVQETAGGTLAAGTAAGVLRPLARTASNAETSAGGTDSSGGRAQQQLGGSKGSTASASSGSSGAKPTTGSSGGNSLAATTPRKGSTTTSSTTTAAVGPSLTAQRVAADSSLTARGNLLPAHADRAMEVVMAPGCSCVVYRGTLTLAPGDGPGGGAADGATAIPVAVKLLTQLAAAAHEAGAGGGRAKPAAATAGDEGDRAEGIGAVQPIALLAHRSPSAFPSELRGQLRMLQAEVAVLSRLDHPNIVKYYGACLDPTATTAGGGAGAASAASGSSGSGARNGSSGNGDSGAGDQAPGECGGKSAAGCAAAAAQQQQMPAGMSTDMPFLVEELMHVPLSRVIHARQANGSGAYLHDYGLVDILRIARDVANALAYLHPTVVHRDLKPANVLLDERGTAKVGDFGLARFKAGTLLATTNVEVGTTPYMAPENFAAGGEAAVSDKSDVLALGVLINEMVTRQRPWTGTRSAVVGYLVAIEGQRPAMAPADHPHCPPGLRSLIQRCWRQNPDERPSGAEIVKRLTLLLATEHAAAV